MNGNSQKVNGDVAILEIHRCQLQTTAFPSWAHCELEGMGGGNKGDADGNLCELLLPALVGLCVLGAFPPLYPGHTLHRSVHLKRQSLLLGSG